MKRLTTQILPSSVFKKISSELNIYRHIANIPFKKIGDSSVQYVPALRCGWARVFDIDLRVRLREHEGGFGLVHAAVSIDDQV